MRTLRWYALSIAFGSWLIAGPGPAGAQPAVGLPSPALPPLDSGIPRPGDEPLERPQFLEERPRPPVEPPSAPAGPEERPLDTGPRFILRTVEFEGNTAFSEDELLTVAEPFLGRLVSTNDLQRLRHELTRYYVERGYINSGAVLPDQKVADGTVRIRIVEGKLDAIEVTGTRRLPKGFVSSRLALGSESLLNVNQLQDRIQVLLDDPKIERLDARLRAGPRPGVSELEVAVEESFFALVSARFANNRPPSIGANSARVDAELRSILGFGETLHFYVDHTSGLWEYSTAFDLPVTPRETRLFVRYRDTASRVIEEPFAALRIRSTAQDLFVGVLHPVYRASGKDLSLGLGLDVRTSQTYIADDIPFSFTPGPRNGKSNVSAIRFSQSWFDRRPEWVLATRSMLSFGVDAFGATANPDPLPDGEYFAWLGQAQWARRLDARGNQLILRADAQLTPDRLLALEKFSIGGARTVRGYRENQLVRDNGYALSAELRIPLWRRFLPAFDLGTLTLELAPFFDVGQSWNHDGPTTDLMGAGAGLRLVGSGRFLGSVYFAKRFGNVIDPPEHTLQDDGIYFSMQAQLVW